MLFFYSVLTCSWGKCDDPCPIGHDMSVDEVVTQGSPLVPGQVRDQVKQLRLGHAVFLQRGPEGTPVRRKEMGKN